jgi:hypothetical protein
MGLSSRFAGLAISAAVASSMSGCGGLDAAEEGAAAVATEFHESVDGDPRAACALLAPGTLSELEGSAGPCGQVLPEQDLSEPGQVRRVEVYGRDAWVEVGADVVILARFPSGWRVTAAGCRPVPERPYDCVLKGP